MSLRPCLTCGEPTTGSWCDEHQRGHNGADHDQTSTRRGYDSRWRRLSERARKLQPWCSDCMSTEDLTGDHLRWPARTLADVDVVCRSCNSKRGALRGDNPRGDTPSPDNERPGSAARVSVTHGNGSR